MKAVSKFLAGAAAVAVASVGFAAPAAAQYYPPYGGYDRGLGNVIVGAVLDSILRGGYGGYGYGRPGYGQYGYGQNNERFLIDQCARATEQQLNRSRYGSYAPYYRVVQIDRVERRNNGLKVWGFAGSGGAGNYGGYGGGYGQYGYAAAPEFRFDCNVDYRGRVRDVDLNRNNYAYRY